jgi:hypothetical protein
MKIFLFTALIAMFPSSVAVLAGPAPSDEKVEPKGSAVAYDEHNGHYVSNKFEMKGDSAYLAIVDRDTFDKVFGVAAVGGGKKFNWVPKDAFEKKIAVAAIKQSAAEIKYKVDKVTADGETLYVQYTTETKGSATGTATFRPYMILTVDKAKIKKVIFIENGKQAETVEVGKGS